MLNVLKLLNFQLNEVATTCVPISYNMSDCWNFVPHYFYEVFSCEEAALEGQMSVCVSVCLSPKLNITKVRLFEVYTKPIDCTRVHTTSLLYKCIQN